MRAVHLRCEGRENPLGIDEARPNLGWWLEDDRKGARQTAYRVLVASSPRLLAHDRGDLWDSGKVRSDENAHVAYGGSALPSRRRAFWKVRVWDGRGKGSPWSRPAWWEMGLLGRRDWQAKWIGAPLVGGPRATVPCPYLRKTFDVGKTPVAARLYVTALGLHECSLNGRPAGEDALAPGWTDFEYRVRYQVYDVGRLVHCGRNAFGAILGDGWYCGHIEKMPRQRYGDRPKLLGQLEIRFADGTRQTVCSDGTWKVGFGPLLEADLIMGETYDARLEMPGWDTPRFDDRCWQAAVEFPDPGAARVAQAGPPIRRIEEVRPVANPVRRGKGWIFDLGQNMVGVARLKVKGPAGRTVTIRYAEMLNPDGTLYTANLRTARATDHYTLRGGGTETWTPRFTFHGFRYVELQDVPAEPGRDAVSGVVLHSAMEPTGSFACSDRLVNQLQRNIVWGQKGNFLDVPTDCPQRDERLGWMGDAQVFCRTACFSMDASGFFRKWFQDMRDSQGRNGSMPSIVPISHPGIRNTDGGPGWADAVVICPWTVYLCYGDKRILADHYRCMTRYLGYLRRTSRGYLRCWDGCGYAMGYGDWLALDGSGKTDGGTPKDLIGTAFFARSAWLMSRIALALGKRADAVQYERLFEKICAAFQRRFVTPDGRIVGQTQTCYVLALHFDLLPERLRPAAVAEVARDIEKRKMHLSTGFLGTPYLPHVLTRFGRTDLAYALLNQKTWPSWLYAVTEGATTIWERWDGWTRDKGFQEPGMNSFNHYAYGAIGEWLYGRAAGLDLDPAKPGGKRFMIEPHPGGGLTRARVCLRTPHGEAEAEWVLRKRRFVLDVIIPANTTSSVLLPGARKAVEIGAGRYRLQTALLA
jgi:alpha-L-rhamnosidase